MQQISAYIWGSGEYNIGWFGSLYWLPYHNPLNKARDFVALAFRGIQLAHGGGLGSRFIGQVVPQTLLRLKLQLRQGKKKKKQESKGKKNNKNN